VFRQAAIVSALLAAAATARASTLDTEMRILAGQVKLELAQRGDSVSIGEFTAADRSMTGGPRIALALKGELEKMGVTVGKGAAVTLSGRFGPVMDANSGKAALRVTAKLTETASGKSVVEFRSRGVFELAEIAAVTGVTLSTPPSAPKAEREKTIEEALDKPPAPAVKGTRVSATPGSPYGIELLVGPDPGSRPPDLARYRPCAPATNDKGQAMLPIGRGEVYAVKLINDSKYDAAVQLTIDGVNVFAFSENKGYTVVIVPAGSTGVVPGWHRSNDRSDAFQVAEYAKSVAAQGLGASSDVGTIHAVFKAAWAQDASPPPDEPASHADGPQSRDGDATARGQSIDARYSEVVRNVGLVRESVSVRYNKSIDPTDLPASAPGK
jgi:hypothetical protein